ncbi:MAG: O-methyltransferase [Clostridia bacterium]
MELLKQLNAENQSDMAQMRQNAYERHIPVLMEETERLLDVIIKIKQPKRILEIGTAIGFSGIVMLKASPMAHLNTIEESAASIEAAKTNFEKYNVNKRVTIFEGDAREIVPMLTGSYDFIFMDGPKGQYLEFFPYLKSILESGGVLMCDNVLYKGLVQNIPEKRHKHITIARNLKAFLEAISNDNQLSTVTLQIGDGVSISVNKVAI